MNITKYIFLTSLAFIIYLFTPIHGHSQSEIPESAQYNTAGTYTYVVPEGYRASVRIELWGGGGGGGIYSYSDKGTPGGGAAYTSKECILPAGEYEVIVGTAGEGGYSPFGVIAGNNATDGGDSHFSFGDTELVAYGGKRGTFGIGAGGDGGAASTDNSDMQGAFNSYRGGKGGQNNGSINGAGGGGSAFNNGPGENGKNPTASQPGDGGNGTGKGGKGTSRSTSGSGGVGRVIITVLQPLPVTFVSFDVMAVDKDHALLEWKTTAEINNNHFVIERADLNNEFKAISTIESKGNSAAHEVQKYSFIDKESKSGRNYYRIKQVDHDGDFSYSEVRQVRIDKQKKSPLVLYPNPATGKSIYLKGNEDSGQITVTNSLGIIVLTESIAQAKTAIDISQLSSGTYYLKFAKANGEIQESTFLVN